LTAQLFLEFEIVLNAILLGINGSLLFKQQQNIKRLDVLIYQVGVKSRILEEKFK